MAQRRRVVPASRLGPGSRLLVCSLALALGACASPLAVRSLATGRADLAAYELTGSEPAALRQLALRLCPRGAEILREGAHAQRPQPAEGSGSQWLAAASDWVDPPQRSAQLVVLCHETPGGSVLSAARPAVPAASAGAPDEPASGPAGGPAGPPAAPIGPISVEW